MLSVTSLRAGTTFEENNNIFEVISYEHIKMGRGSASVKVRVRNLRSGAVLEKGFISHAEVKEIYLEKKEFQYLYKDSNLAYFMDPVSFEQQTIPLENLEGYQYLKEGETVGLRFYGVEVLGVSLAPKVTLVVKDTPPGVKGNSASNVYKDATLENGMKIRVPLFINSGDKVIVDTRDGSYTKRA